MTARRNGLTGTRPAGVEEQGKGTMEVPWERESSCRFRPKRPGLGVPVIHALAGGCKSSAARRSEKTDDGGGTAK